MAIERAWARVTAGASPSIIGGRRAASVARNGPGDYTVTWDEEFVADGTNYGVRAGLVDTANNQNHIDAVAVTDTTTRVRTNANGVAVDVNFCVEVFQASS